MKRMVACVAMAACVALATGCAQIEKLVGAAGAKAGLSSKPPEPRPALGAAEARRVVDAWARDFNRAARTYDTTALPRIATGALLEGYKAEFATRRSDHGPVPLMAGASGLAIPRFTAWPKWFTAAVAGRAKKRVIHQMVFVQRTSGGPWRAAADAVLDEKLVKTMGRYVQAPPDAKVVPAGDRSLKIAPNRLAAAHAHLVRHGYLSPHAKLFGDTANVVAEHRQLMGTHRLFKRNGLTGRTTVRPAPHPMYVLRTPSGGAMAIYAVDRRLAYRRVQGDATFTRVVVRAQYASYIPPRNTSEIQVFAARWTVIRTKPS